MVGIYLRPRSRLLRDCPKLDSPFETFGYRFLDEILLLGMLLSALESVLHVIRLEKHSRKGAGSHTCLLEVG